MSSSPVGKHFDSVAPGYDRWKEKARHYYAALKASLVEIVPPRNHVLEVGCATGDILASLDPADGVGIDISPAMIQIASRKHPDLRFLVHDLMDGPIDERFEYVVAADVAEHVPDLDVCVQAMAGMLTENGVLVIVTANPAWGPVLHLAERLHLKMPEGDHQWRSRGDLVAAAVRAGLRERSFTRSLLVPKDLAGVGVLDRAAWASGIRERFGLIQRAVFETGRGPRTSPSGLVYPDPT
jgi:SAM-dependent methyltransferase